MDKLLIDLLGPTFGALLAGAIGGISIILLKLLADYLLREAARRKSTPDKSDDGPITFFESVGSVLRGIISKKEAEAVKPAAPLANVKKIEPQKK